MPSNASKTECKMNHEKVEPTSERKEGLDIVCLTWGGQKNSASAAKVGKSDKETPLSLDEGF